MDINSGYWRKEMGITTPPFHWLQPLYSEILSQFVRAKFSKPSNFLEGYGFTLIRFVPDNPGAWALHCHITWHMEAGLLMTFLSGAAKIDAMVAQAPTAWKNLCSV